LPLLVYLELIAYATVKIVNGDARGLWLELLTLSISLWLLTKRAPLAKKGKRKKRREL